MHYHATIKSNTLPLNNSRTPIIVLLSLFFQRELSIIDFTLNYQPIRNNLTSASLLSMLIETDYLNYPPIRNNFTSASLLSMIIEMYYNLLGMKAGTVPRRRAKICRARNIFFLSRSTKRCNSVFFFVALSSANSIINNCQYKNTLFISEIMLLTAI